MWSTLCKGRVAPRYYTKGRVSVEGFAIHHMAGNMLAKNCVTWLGGENSPRRSCNYAIGSDGEIWAGVDENDTSWCTSNQNVDRRVITIEVANDGGASTDWHVSKEAIDSLVDLMVDICDRHGIKKVTWLGSEDHKADFKTQNITVHKWFSATPCPGPYLYSKLGEIADRVNNRLGNEHPAEELLREIKEMIDKYMEGRS